MVSTEWVFFRAREPTRECKSHCLLQACRPGVATSAPGTIMAGLFSRGLTIRAGNWSSLVPAPASLLTCCRAFGL